MPPDATPPQHRQIAPLPRDARPAVRIVELLRDAGHEALLAGGCVRDLLLGLEPKDYDVATDATPDRVCAILRPTRKVGVQFGVILARSLGHWVEVATFRSDGRYEDGRRPASVSFGDARADALRRDFTLNGMFLDPISGSVVDYVGGRDDLNRRVLRAIGDPATRFAEDHLRLLRGVRIAARLGLQIEPQTLDAMRATAPSLERVATERVLDELERMLSDARRAAAFDLMAGVGLLAHLWAGASWTAEQATAARQLMSALPADAPFELGLTALLIGRGPGEIDDICRRLTCSNEQRETVVWLAAHLADLDEPQAPPLPALKRLMAHPAFGLLRAIADVRHRGFPDGERRGAALNARLASIPVERIAPPPFVTGADLQERSIPPGPIYKRVLEEIYTAQLAEALPDRASALALLERLLRESDGGA